LRDLAARTALSIVSVVWNALTAAEAYIGEAGAWLSSHLGIGKLANQFASGLKTVASARSFARSRRPNVMAFGWRIRSRYTLDKARRPFQFRCIGLGAEQVRHSTPSARARVRHLIGKEVIPT
jgi:hypothetical protein